MDAHNPAAHLLGGQILQPGSGAMTVTWQNQIANAYAAKVAKLEQAARDNSLFAKRYLKTAKELQKTVDLYRTMVQP